MESGPAPEIVSQSPLNGTTPSLKELVTHLRHHRVRLCEAWVYRITAAQLLTAMSQSEIVAEAAAVYDNYVKKQDLIDVREFDLVLRFHRFASLSFM